MSFYNFLFCLPKKETKKGPRNRYTARFRDTALIFFCSLVAWALVILFNMVLFTVRFYLGSWVYKIVLYFLFLREHTEHLRQRGENIYITYFKSSITFVNSTLSGIFNSLRFSLNCSNVSAPITPFSGERVFSL